VDTCTGDLKLNCPNDKVITNATDKRVKCVDLGGGGVATVLNPNPSAPKSQVGVDFHQPRNQDHPAVPLYWTNGINNQTQSEYFEGMGNPQRIIFTGIQGGPVHTLKIRHEAVKHQAGDRHAYDFMMSWQQAVATAGDIGNNSVNELQNLLAQTCNGQIFATSTGICNGYSNSATTSLPDNMGNPPNHHGIANVNDNIKCFEAKYGNRTIEIDGNAPISNFSVVFDGYDGTATGDNYAWYTISWTSSSSDVMIKLAGRLAMGDGTCGYGQCYGAGSIHGGPYHFKLDLLDGYSLGDRDNQIMVGKMCDVETAVTFGTPSINDACDPKPVLTVANSDSSYYDAYGNKWHCRRWVASDACGRTAECSQCIEVTCAVGKRQADPDAFEITESDNVSINVYPNPFSDKTTIDINPSVDYNHAVVELFDINGQRVKTLFSGSVSAFQVYRFEINASDLASGVYMYSFRGDEESVFGKIVLIK